MTAGWEPALTFTEEKTRRTISPFEVGIFTATSETKHIGEEAMQRTLRTTALAVLGTACLLATSSCAKHSYSDQYYLVATNIKLSYMGRLQIGLDEKRPINMASRQRCAALTPSTRRQRCRSLRLSLRASLLGFSSPSQIRPSCSRRSTKRLPRTFRC